MLCAFDFDGTLADSKYAYYKTLHRYAAQHNFPVPSQLEMDMAFGNPNRYDTDFQVYDARAKDPQNTILDIYIGLAVG